MRTCRLCRAPLRLPVTLQCGHSFCQVCVQGAIHSVGRSRCVVCDRPYKEVPGVNLALQALLQRFVSDAATQVEFAGTCEQATQSESVGAPKQTQTTSNPFSSQLYPDLEQEQPIPLLAPKTYADLFEQPAQQLKLGQLVRIAASVTEGAVGLVGTLIEIDGVFGIVSARHRRVFVGLDDLELA